MKKFLQFAAASMNKNEFEIRESAVLGEGGFRVYKDSIRKYGGMILCMARDMDSKFLLLISQDRNADFAGFAGEDIEESSVIAKKIPLTAENASVLRKWFPWTAPMPVLREKCSIGCGDRLGLASAAHAYVFCEYDAYPVFAQQSIRELTLTSRTYRNVIDDATFLVFQAGYDKGYGADGDHLKTFEQIEDALAVGVTMLTLDLSEQLHPEFAGKTGSELLAAFQSLPGELKTRLSNTYSGRSFEIGDIHLRMQEEELMRCAVIYSDALDFAKSVGEMLERHGAGKIDLEISIDETTAPTLPEHHYFVANELKYRGVNFASLAPRFIGEFQKGIDYIGNLEEFKKQFREHAAIADHFGTYKISIHSGSDKFMVFPYIGEFTHGRFHLKTAGTSWLEALRTIANADPGLFRDIWRRALQSLDAALKLYHITADFGKLPPLDSISDYQLPKLLEDDTARQLLHITYGAMLGENAEMKKRIYSSLHRYENIYNDLLYKHFEKHLSLLGVPKRRQTKTCGCGCC